MVTADWLVTTPNVIIQPLTGFWMLHLAGLALETTWIWLSLLLYGIAGACWLPVVVLQIRMRDLSQQAAESGEDLGPAYLRMARAWFWLGVPAFLAMVTAVWLMTVKSI